MFNTANGSKVLGAPLNDGFDVRGHGPLNWCPRSKYIVPAPEHMIHRDTKCSDTHILTQRGEHGIPCAYKDLYGRVVVGGDGETYYFLEIPKTASSTIKSLMNPLCKYGDKKTIGSGSGCGELHLPGVSTPEDVKSIKAFTFMRHPVVRFVSGYGTVVHREKEWKDPELRKLLTLPEPERFIKFVDKYTKSGLEVLEKGGVVFTHLLSQTFFLDLWPGPIDFVGRTEMFQESVNKLSTFLHKNLTTPKHLTNNEGSLDKQLLMNASKSIQLVHDYFRIEMNRYGYKPLEGFH